MIKRIGILLISAMTIFSGCVTDEITQDQIIQKMKEKQESINDFSATMVVTISFGGQTMVTKTKIMNKMSDKTKMEYVEPSDLVGQLVISNGTTVLFFDPKTKIVTKENILESEGNFQQNYIESIEEILDKTDITYQGMEKFKRQTVYIIKAVPKDESKHYYIWVDSRIWMPIRVEIAGKNDDPVASFEYNDIKFNTDIPDSEFDIPQSVR